MQDFMPPTTVFLVQIIPKPELRGSLNNTSRTKLSLYGYTSRRWKVEKRHLPWFLRAASTRSTSPPEFMAIFNQPHPNLPPQK